MNKEHGRLCANRVFFFYAERAGKEEKEKEFPIPISTDLITSLRGKDERKGEIIGTRKDYVSI